MRSFVTRETIVCARRQIQGSRGCRRHLTRPGPDDPHGRRTRRGGLRSEQMLAPSPPARVGSIRGHSVTGRSGHPWVPGLTEGTRLPSHERLGDGTRDTSSRVVQGFVSHTSPRIRSVVGRKVTDESFVFSNCKGRRQDSSTDDPEPESVLRKEGGRTLPNLDSEFRLIDCCTAPSPNLHSDLSL